MREKKYKLSFKNQLRAIASLTVYRVGRQQYEPLETPEQKYRTFYVINLIIKGRGTYILNNRSYPAREGDAFVIYPNMPIDYIADEDDPWEFWWVGFNGTDAGFLLNLTRFSIKEPVITLSDPDFFRNLISDIYAVRGNLPHETIQMSSKLYSFLAFLIRDNENILGQNNEQGAVQFQCACDYIAEHYNESINIMDISRSLGVCRSRLYRIFMQQISMSPQKYLTEFRIRRACMMIASTDKSIKEISFKVGFKDQMYFSTVFKSIIGTTPTEFRNSASARAVQLKQASQDELQPSRDIWRIQE